MLGVCLAAEQQRPEALWALQRAVRLAPALAPAREALAELFDTLNRESERIEQLEALAALEPDRADRSIALAMARAETGRINQAVLVLGRAAERRPDDTSIDRALATVWLRVAESDDDPAAVEKALEATRTLVGAGRPTGTDLLLHGRALLRAGDAASALPVLREAATRVPIDPDAYDLLAVAAEREDARHEAKWALERLVTLPGGRNRAPAYARIAALALGLGQPAEAVRWLEQAIDAAPRDLTLLPRLAEAQLAAGAPDLAKQTVQSAVAAGVDTPVLQQVTAKLQSAARPRRRP